MEIDLLRAGMHTVAAPVDKVAAHRHDYLVSVNRARQARKSFELYFIQLRQQLPTVGVPLANGDPDVPLDLQSVLQRVYDAGRFRSRIRYEKAPIPPLPPPEQSWASELVAAAGAKPPAT